MRRRCFKDFSIGVMFLLTFLAGFVAPLAAAPGNGMVQSTSVMEVQVERTFARSAPTVTASIIAELTYRTPVMVTAVGGGWARIIVPLTGREGYVFLSSLTSKPVAATSEEAARSGVSGTELVLAGKGFADSLEESYRQSSGVDFSWVDYMESFEFPADECVRFLAGM